MIIYFVRHGESIDDIEDRYGGWADYSLTEKGIRTAKETGEKLKQKNLGAEIVFTSPLLRASQTADQISKILNLNVIVDQYLKERNTYGLLCGVNKTDAKTKYPELVAAYENNQPVAGYEPYESFLTRVRQALVRLASLSYKKIICVGHRGFMRALFSGILGKEAKDFLENSIIELDLKQGGEITLINQEGVVF